MVVVRLRVPERLCCNQTKSNATRKANFIEGHKNFILQFLDLRPPAPRSSDPTLPDAVLGQSKL